MTDEAPLRMPTRRPRRPITVWIVQIWFAVLLLGGIAVSAIGFGRLATIGSQSETAGKPFVVSLLLFVASIATFFGLVGTAFVGLQRRKAYGRWLAVALLVLFLAYGVYEHPNPFALEQDNCELCLHYDNEAQLEGGRDARVAMDLVCLILIWRMISAKSVKSFFEDTTSVAVVEGRADLSVTSTE